MTTTENMGLNISNSESELFAVDKFINENFEKIDDVNADNRLSSLESTYSALNTKTTNNTTSINNHTTRLTSAEKTIANHTSQIAALNGSPSIPLAVQVKFYNGNGLKENAISADVESNAKKQTDSDGDITARSGTIKTVLYAVIRPADELPSGATDSSLTKYYLHSITVVNGSKLATTNYNGSSYSANPNVKVTWRNNQTFVLSPIDSGTQPWVYANESGRKYVVFLVGLTI